MEAACRLGVMESFATLQTALKAFGEQLLADQSLPAWVETPTLLNLPGNVSNHQRAWAAIRQIEYTDAQDPREILLAPGIIGASEKTLQAIMVLNDAKHAFKSAMLKLKRLKISKQDKTLAAYFENALGVRAAAPHQALKRLGLARLQLKQCYRILPILHSAPQKISWTWANTRSIRKISTEQAAILLRKQGTDTGIDIQLQKLGALSEKESLAIVQELAPHLRANLVFKNDDGDIERKMVKGAIPIFFPATPTSILPAIKTPKPKQTTPDGRLQRADTKLDPNPYLPAIRAHRYLVD